MNAEPMRLLLIEDEIGDALKFTDCAKRRKDIKFVGMTDSSEEGLNLVKSRLPEGVILDLQLVRGTGSGLQFLKDLKAAELTLRPFVVVTTSKQSEAIYKLVEGLGADWFFDKLNPNYDEDFVIDTLLTLRGVLDAQQKKKPPEIPVQGDLHTSREMVESPDDRRDRIYNRIDIELDLVGVRTKLKGRTYLRDAIYLKIQAPEDRGSCIEEVAAMHKHAYGTLVKTMETAIAHAWKNTDAEELRTHYTDVISAKTGIPYVSDFIHHYASKIRSTI